MLNLLTNIWMGTAKLRRRRALKQARREITSCGYRLEGLSDSQLEKALTRGQGNVEDFIPLTGRRINWTLRRISQTANQSRE